VWINILAYQITERGIAMKNKIAQLVYFASKIDPSYIKFAYFAFTLAALLVVRNPSDGGVGPS
jgi:hypothetical protein